MNILKSAILMRWLAVYCTHTKKDARLTPGYVPPHKPSQKSVKKMKGSPLLLFPDVFQSSVNLSPKKNQLYFESFFGQKNPFGKKNPPKKTMQSVKKLVPFPI